MYYFAILLPKINDPAEFALWVGWYVAEGALAIVGLHMVLRFAAEAQSAIGEELEKHSLMLIGIVGWIAATAAIWWVCSGPFLLPGWAGARTVAIYIVATLAAGTVATLIAWSAQNPKPATGWVQLSLSAAVGWAFLPCVMMLAKGRSPMALAMALGATVPAVVGLRRVFDARGFVDDPWRDHAEQDRPALPYLFGTPKVRSWYRMALWVAICAQGAVVLAVADKMVIAAFLVMMATAVAFWRWSSALRVRTEATERTLRMRAIAATALAFMIALLTQRLAPNFVAPHIATVAHAAEKNGHYFSVVLTQPKKKKETLIMPSDLGLNAESNSRKPMVIPFDGPYWYFQPPLSRPDASAHTAEGKASEANVHATNEIPLFMQANQMLVRPIALSCCRELDIAVTNADARPGRIELMVLLQNSLSRDHALVVLPQQTLATSLGRVNGRPPVSDTLRFPIPANAAQRVSQFDEITVVFVPEAFTARLLSGTKVDIESFTLLPK